MRFSRQRTSFVPSNALLGSIIVPLLFALIWTTTTFVGQCSRVVVVEASFVTPKLQSRRRQQQQQQNQHTVPKLTPGSNNKGVSLLNMSSRREDEIRRKIAQLKRQGKIKNDRTNQEDGGETTKTPSVSEQYGDKLRQKLGTRKAKLLGTYGQGSSSNDGDDDAMTDDPLIAELDKDDDDEEEVISTTRSSRRTAQLGALPQEEETDEEDDQSTISSYKSPSSSQKPNKEYKNFDAFLFEDDNDDEDDEDQLSEQDLIELVAAKLAEKQRREEHEKEERLQQRLEELKKEQSQEQPTEPASSTEKVTSGIGGRWIKNPNSTAAVEEYKPSKSGTWGVFERPKDISRAFGGGKRVGAGYTPDNINKQKSEEDTRERLKQYREKVGIEVQSEKDHAADIEEALAIGKRAMERGIYSTAVSALEKVTKWCSTNSAVGGKVFLELAMAYEAVGRTQEAILVYTTLSKSRMENIKFNAKRLLYGIEAMQFMQNEARNPEFSRKKIRNTFIDTTGLANIAQNFDDVYNTAYIDLDRGIYKSLTENVVRSNREARQVLLQATGAGEVGRLKVVQALRSLSRHFDDALEEEIQSRKPVKEPVAVMDGKPIVVEPARKEKDDLQLMVGGMDEFLLSSPEQMMENLNGEWRLQLLADKRGDGVKYFNTSLSWQKIDTNYMTFTSSGSAGFLTVAQSGGIEFQGKRRILTRTDLSVAGAGGMLSGFFAKSSGGAAGAISTPHQIVSVDSVLLITRMASLEKKKFDDSTKEFFAVWRRVEPGTFTSLPSR